MAKQKGQLINGCLPDSIAEELGITAGDRLLMIDGQPVRDVFDFRLRQMAEELILTIEQADGTWIEFDIEKEEDEDLGLEFAEALLDDCTHCHNKCVFCFIDQLPKGLRKTLYFKDDDLRLTFLTGNYVTLTNISDDELDRLIGYRFSPMNISVHTTDPVLRKKMMKNPKSGEILERLQRIAAAGIALNTQIVLCPDWNDQEHLERTLQDLAALHPAVQSIAVVPVGVTRFRNENGLPMMRPFSPAECRKVIESVERWQQHFLNARGTYVYHAADEFYLRGELPIPDAKTYDDFPQLENGVGMISLFNQTLQEHVSGEVPIEAAEPFESVWPAKDSAITESAVLKPVNFKRIIIPTGTLAGPVLQEAARLVAEKYQQTLIIQPIRNDFFGDTISVTGLLTGQDVAAQLKPSLQAGDVILLPSCMLKADSPIFLDDWTLQALSDEVKVSVHAVKSDAQGLISGLLWLIDQRRNP